MGQIAHVYGAVCLDTCIYDGYALAFERGMLKQLEQFAAVRSVAFVVPEVVHFELEAHLSERFQRAKTAIAEALRQASNECLVSDDDLKAIGEKLLGDCAQGSESRRLQDFYRRTGASLLPSSHAQTERLVQMYFSSKPPFEAAGKKKAEFPDAIALLSLEAWAIANDCKILVVSTDKGWQNFCKASERLVAVNALGDALAHFQPDVAAALIAELQEIIARAESNEIVTEIGLDLMDHVDEMLVETYAESSLEIAELYSEATYLEHDFMCDSAGQPEINLVRTSPNTLVIKLTASVSCEVTAEYSISFYDGPDRGLVRLGRQKCSRVRDFDAEIVVTLRGDFTSGLRGISVGEIEVQGELGPVNFGDIDPDPEADEWDRERYNTPE